MRYCVGCQTETETDDGVCPECSALARKVLGPRIAELEAALRELLDTFNPEPRMDDIGLIWGRAAKALNGNT